MNHFSFAGLLFLSSSVVAAVNCDTLKLRIDNNELTGYYQESATFPNEPKTHKLQGNYTIDCPDIKVQSTDDYYSIQATKYQDIWKVLQGIRPLVHFRYHSGYIYEYIQEDYYMNHLSLDPKKLRLEYTQNELYGTLGYKINDGELKPLLYNGKINNAYQKEFDKAQKIQIFFKDKSAGFAQSVLIDKNQGLLKVFKKYDFPEK